MKGQPMRRTLLAAGVAAAIAFLAPGATRAAEPFTINVILSLSGYAAFIGGQEQVGLRAVEDLTNKSGGINGIPVHFEIVDDASNPANAIQLANQIVAKNVPVMLGPKSTLFVRSARTQRRSRFETTSNTSRTFPASTA